MSTYSTAVVRIIAVVASDPDDAVSIYFFKEGGLVHQVDLHVLRVCLERILKMASPQGVGYVPQQARRVISHFV